MTKPFFTTTIKLGSDSVKIRGLQSSKGENETDIEDILSRCDHTVLAVDASWEDVKRVCDEGTEFHTASVCVPPSYVKRASDYVAGKIPVCAVAGFPNGYSTTASKVFEVRDALSNGADEIDMVINVGKVKNGEFGDVLNEIKQVKAACSDKILKVIVEAGLLTREEKIKLCRIVSQAGADYIKTSTGFSKGGATREDVKLFAENVGENVKIKAAGGVRSFEDAEAYIALGCDRIGASGLVKLAKALRKKEKKEETI